jgi:hypothetical protein
LQKKELHSSFWKRYVEGVIRYSVRAWGEFFMENLMQFERLVCESDAVHNLKSALRAAISWDAQSVGMQRKVQGVRFVIEALERHMRKLMDLEEREGCLAWIGDCKPNLQSLAAALCAEHDRFRMRLKEIVPRWEAAVLMQADEFNELCDNVRSFLASVERHEARERDLMYSALCDDDGGES